MTPYPFIYLKPEKDTPIGRSFPVKGIIGSTPGGLPRAFRERSSKEQFGGAIWKRQLLDGRNWRNLENGWHYDNHVISLTEICSNSNPKWPLIIALSNSSGVRWTKKGLGPKNHELNVLITPFKPWVSVGLLRGDVIGIPSLRARNTRGQKTCLCGFSLALVWMWKKATVKP